MTQSKRDGKPQQAPDEKLSSRLPSSHGDTSRSTTPRDNSSDDATWTDDRTARNLSAKNSQHDEAVLDEAIEETFPASDPVAAKISEKNKARPQVAGEDSDEELVDESIELTFPASDPPAVASTTRIDVPKDDKPARHHHR